MSHKKKKGVILLLAIFAVALISTLVVGYLLVITTNLQIIRNHQYSEEALYVADAGIEVAIRRLRYNYAWKAGLKEVEFPEGSGNTVTVVVNNVYPTVILTSEGVVSEGFRRIVEAKLMVSGPPLASPYPVRVDYWREK